MSRINLHDYQSPVFAAWRQAAGQTWSDYIDHEFVRGLGDGSLPREAFIAYLIQDYIFLLHFSRAWAMAVVKAATAAQMRTAAATVNALINDEIQLHIIICEREGISEAQLLEATEASENIAYTRYVMDSALSGDLLDLLAALAPCVFGYHQIGLSLADCQNTTPLYREWIDTYSDPEYVGVCDAVGALIEEVTSEKLGGDPGQNPRWKGLCARFKTATELEVNFWQMGLRLGLEG
ncbi:MAG: thiaminase II [Gammaproteobacteria bacterium]